MPWNFVALDAALLRDKSSEAQRRQAQVRGGQGEARCGRERYVEEMRAQAADRR